MYYRLDFFSRSRSGERDLCRCDELLISRSFDDFLCLCFLFDGLRDRPIVSECNTKSKQNFKEIIDNLIKVEKQDIL
jgi:hypothetical protein